MAEFEQRVIDPELGQHAVAGLLDDPGARIEVLVDAVAETHQAHLGILVLDLGHKRFSAIRRCDASCPSISITATLAPPCSGPHRAQTPAATDA